MTQQSGRIMVIDDSRVVREILRVGLGREGFEVECFEDGVEALLSLQEAARRALPDLIVLDVMLPQMDGYEVARLLKSRPDLSDIVIVMLTRRDGVLDRLKGRLAGASAYLTKPFRMNEVIRVVREQLGATQAVNSCQ